MGTSDRSLSAISYTTTTGCTAVGNYDASKGGNSLVEHWNGTSWRIDSSLHTPAGTSLTAVSCTTAVVCAATGFFEPADIGYQAPLIIRSS